MPALEAALTFRKLVLFAAATHVATAALAATDPPPVDHLAAAVDRIADLLERGGTAVIVAEVVLGIASLSALASMVLVLVQVVQALPRAARPVADAWATIWRGGATQREEALIAENVTLRANVEALSGKVEVLEHADEEHRRIVGALLVQLEAAHIDVAAVRAIYAPQPVAA